MRIKLPYRPREQFRAFHDRTQRFSILVCHRGAGKTLASINALQRSALTCTKPDGRFVYVAPFLRQAKQAAWTHLKSAAVPLLGIGATINESELRVDYPNGSQVRLFGADNPDALRGMHPDGAVLDEYADMDPETWTAVLLPALGQRLGWAVHIGTPKGHNAFYDMWQKRKVDQTWFSMMLKASESGLVPPEQLEILKAELDKDEYAQEMECSFDAAIKGSFYGEELRRAEADGRICALPIDRALPIDTGWDLGVSDATGIWFVQTVGLQHRLVDYYEASGVGFDHYAKVLREKGYVYGRHYFPHDIAHHEISSGKSRVETMRGLGIEPTYNPDPGNVLDGINAVRRMLDQSWQDPGRCARGLDALKSYRREWDEKGKIWRSKPYHDWSSHGADALRSFAVQYLPTRKPFVRSSLGGGSWMGG